MGVCPTKHPSLFTACPFADCIANGCREDRAAEPKAKRARTKVETALTADHVRQIVREEVVRVASTGQPGGR